MDFNSSCLSLDCLIHIFAFLEEDDLIRASGVCKVWHEAAETPWLWRQMCLQRWTFCNVTRTDCGKRTWKRYYQQRSKLESRMETGRSGADYTCKSLRGHSGSIIGLVYLVSNSDQNEVWNSAPVVCSASTDGTVRAWDAQQGVQLWATPAQAPFVTSQWILTWGSCSPVTSQGGSLPGRSCQDRKWPLSSRPPPDAGCWLTSTEGQSAVMVGTSGGWNQVVYDTFKIDPLIASPDKKWVFTATKENFDMSPKVFSSESLICPSEDGSPLCQSVPVSGCHAAAFMPSEPARIALIHSGEDWHSNTVSIFDISTKKSKYETGISVQQVESFQLATSRGSDVLLQTRGSDTLVVAMANTLRVYTSKGVMLASFEDHTQPIAALCVDSFRVVTASRDLSLRVLTWKKERDRGLTLQSKFHLLGGSHSMSRGFTKVACDYVSIVASVQAVDGNDVLKAYSFNS
ncbi:hypothetical protein AGOR_G00130860 [Albula goreensis]|uniref:F-box domain-containing protein n=1 Tax=Albula goreensis TaxID=1534307 RepID=A0A8T3D3J0_9TELE|nr:hypothetical protein AGOR_G00130860 [Albula goreensis]